MSMVLVPVHLGTTDRRQGLEKQCMCVCEYVGEGWMIVLGIMFGDQ